MLADPAMVANGNELLVEEPLVLPKKKHTLFLPQQPDLVHPLYQKLTILICHFSGNHLKAEAYGIGYLTHPAVLEKGC